MTRKIRSAIVGCGKVGHIHAKGLQSLREANFVAVCDQNQKRVEKFAKKYQIAPYTDVGEMVNLENGEAVFVCTPHPLHAEPAISAMQNGAHVMVEKPLASNLKDCDAMIAAAENAGVKLGVMGQRRLYPPVQRVKQAIVEGKIGKAIIGIVMMFGWRDENYYQSDPWRGTWQNEGGGVLANQASHQLDLLQWMMGPIEELFGYWDNLNHPYIEVDDTAIAVIRFKNGAMGSIVVSNSQKPGLYGKVHIHGDNGASVGVQTDGGAMFIAGMSEIEEYPMNDLWTIPEEENKLDAMYIADMDELKGINLTNYFHALQDQDFLKAIINDQNPMITGQQGRVTVEIFTAIYRSQRDRQPIKFPVVPDDGFEDYDGRLVKHN